MRADLVELARCEGLAACCDSGHPQSQGAPFDGCVAGRRLPAGDKVLDILPLGGMWRQAAEPVERIVGDRHALIWLDQHNAFARRGQHGGHMVVCVAHGGEELEAPRPPLRPGSRRAPQSLGRARWVLAGIVDIEGAKDALRGPERHGQQRADADLGQRPRQPLVDDLGANLLHGVAKLRRELRCEGRRWPDLHGDAEIVSLGQEDAGADRAGHLDDATGCHGEDLAGLAQAGVDRHAEGVQGGQAAQVVLEQVVGAHKLLRAAGQRLVDLRKALGVLERDHRLVGHGLQRPLILVGEFAAVAPVS